MGHVAIAVSFLCRQKIAPAIEARVSGRIGWQVVVGVCRRVVARFIGIGRIDRDCRRTTCRSALELECARPHIATIFVPGDPAPARAAADIHQRAFGKIENKLGLRSGRRPKRYVGGGLAHHANAVPVLMASATAAASILIRACMRAPPLLSILAHTRFNFIQHREKLTGEPSSALPGIGEHMQRLIVCHRAAVVTGVNAALRGTADRGNPSRLGELCLPPAFSARSTAFP